MNSSVLQFSLVNTGEIFFYVSSAPRACFKRLFPPTSNNSGFQGRHLLGLSTVSGNEEQPSPQEGAALSSPVFGGLPGVSEKEGQRGRRFLRLSLEHQDQTRESICPPGALQGLVSPGLTTVRAFHQGKRLSQTFPT